MCILLKDEEKALGAVGFAWKSAQRYWCPDKKPIPLDVFGRISSGPFLIEVGLARQTEEGVYIAGAEEHFQWWFDGIEQRREAGKKSATRPRDEKGRLLPNEMPNDANETQRPLDDGPTAPNEVQPSSSSSFSKTKKEEELKAGSLRKPPTLSVSRQKPVDTPRMVATYCEAYKTKFGHRPSVSSKEVGLFKALGLAEGVDVACQMIQVYLQMTDAWFQTKNYDVASLWENRNKVKLALNTGREDPTKKSVEEELMARGVRDDDRGLLETN